MIPSLPILFNKISQLYVMVRFFDLRIMNMRGKLLNCIRKKGDYVLLTQSLGKAIK